MIIRITVFIALFYSAPAFSQYKVFNEADEAFTNKDYGRYLALGDQLIKISRHPNVLYRLAQSCASLGKRQEAIEFLQELGKKGLAYDLTSKEAFKDLKSDERFNQLVRKFDLNRTAVDKSSVGFTLSDKELIPEGIAVDQESGDFFISSLAKWKVVRKEKSMPETDFVKHNQDGIWSTIGMKVDSRNSELWVCSATEKGTENGFSGVFVFDLRTGKLKRKYVLDNSIIHFFNDLALDGMGNAFITDSKPGRLYKIIKGKGHLEEMNSSFIYPNGIALDDKGENLFIADFTGLTRLHLPTQTYHSIDDQGITYLQGIDGLSFYNNTLIAIQDSDNKDTRVVRFHLDTSMLAIEKAEVLQSFRDDFVFPTTGTIYKDNFYYIANSFLGNLNPDMTFVNPEKLKKPLILKITLN